MFAKQVNGKHRLTSFPRKILPVHFWNDDSSHFPSVLISRQHKVIQEHNDLNGRDNSRLITTLISWFKVSRAEVLMRVQI
jgi:hypothetical protein